MSADDGQMPMESGDEPGLDARLRAALAHAPDAELRPSPAVRTAVLQAARGTTRPAVPATLPVRGWRRWWAAAMAPRSLATAASVACVGIALKLAWPEPEWVADVAEVSPAVVAPAPQRKGIADAPPALVQDEAPAARGARPPTADEPTEHAAAAKAAPQNERARESTTPPLRREATRPGPVPAPAPAPAVTTTAVPPPPPPPPAPVVAATPPAAPTVAMAPPPGEATAPAVDPRAAKALAADAYEGARRALSEVTTASLAKPAPPGHPAALARWAQALAAAAGEGTVPPAGWQLRRDGADTPWGPPQQAWWQALLAGAAGRWVLDAGAPVAGEAWQLRAPDGEAFTLRVGPDTLWLVGDGGSWRAPRPAGLPAAP